MAHRLAWCVASVLVVACGGDDVPTGGGTESSTGSTSPSTSASSTTVASQTGTETTTTTTPDESSSSGGGSGSSTSDDPSTGAMTESSGNPTSSSGDEMSSSSSTGMGETETTGNAEVSCPPQDPDTTITGTVWAPNGEIPVSHALVYTTQNLPQGIPQEVYCADCAQLECDDLSTFTNFDGTFSLDINAAEAQYLVVQKGQFMRVTVLGIGGGGVAPLGAIYTTLPDHNDPDNGIYMPLIAVADGSYDRLEDALGKAGLGDTMISNFEERLVPGTEPFDLWDNGASPSDDGFLSQGTFAELVADPDLLAQYHIIFVPCSTDDWVDSLSDDDVVDNIRNWVAAGGRWYVADWAHEWMGMVFPEYQEFEGGNGSGGDLGSYDSLADVMDDDMLAWLGALPPALQDINPLNDETHPTLNDLPQLQTVDNWSAITDIPPVLVDDGMGGQVDVGHRVWLEGNGLGLGVHPLTVTGQYGCGKIQFTSYHTAEFFDYVGLSPQELVLLYTILEIGVCQQDLPT